MPRKLTDWNLLVKKVFEEGKRSDKNYTFKQALKDASKRKGNTKKNNKKYGGEEEEPNNNVANVLPSLIAGKKRRVNKTKRRTRRH